ncbi:MAG TPA: hypothetical protein DCY13_23290 [Verrucomicrobiales bacterium]|nr:hypothetical protein [Verrucomicrobiales bacterium]
MRTATTILALCVAALLVLGSVTLYSAVMVTGGEKFMRQMLYLLLGLVVCVSLALIDYRRWKTWMVWVILGSALLLLALVFVPGIGRTINGANRWIFIAGVQLQPSELARLAMILALAAYADRHQRRMNTFRHGIVGTCLIAGPVLALVLLGRDLSTTAALGCLAGTLIFVSGVRWLHVMPVAALLLAGLVAYVAQSEMRMNRIRAFLEPSQFQETIAVQNSRAATAMTVGGPGGLGLADSPFKKGSHNVPLHFSDFIFSVVGAEGGLVATLGTVTLYLLLLLSGIYIAWHSRDVFGMLLATGITLSICLQAFVHMGVVTGILPNTGFPLPFISHGGTNLIVTLAGIGLLFSIARQGLVRRQSKNPFDRHIEVPVAESA